MKADETQEAPRTDDRSNNGARLIALRIRMAALQRAALAADHDETAGRCPDAQRVSCLFRAINDHLAALESTKPRSRDSRGREVREIDQLEQDAARFAFEWMRGLPRAHQEAAANGGVLARTLLLAGRNEDAGDALLAMAMQEVARGNGPDSDRLATLAWRAFSLGDDAESAAWLDQRQRHDKLFDQWKVGWAELDALAQQFASCAGMVNSMIPPRIFPDQRQQRLRCMEAALTEFTTEVTVEYMYDEERCAEIQALLEVIEWARSPGSLPHYRVSAGRFADMVQVKRLLPELRQKFDVFRSMQSASRTAREEWGKLRSPVPSKLDSLIHEIAALGR